MEQGRRETTQTNMEQAREDRFKSEDQLINYPALMEMAQSALREGLNSGRRATVEKVVAVGFYYGLRKPTLV